jgi:ankyrin repeat protein
MYLPDDDFDDEDGDEYIYFADDPLRKRKPLLLSDFLPQAQISGTFDWGTGQEAEKQPRLILITMENGEKIVVDDLRLAAINGNLDVVKKILSESKMAVDTPLKDELTALIAAASAAQDQVVLFLLQSDADPNIGKNRYFPLMAAAGATADCEDSVLEQRIVACINHLIQFGAKVNAVDVYQTPALHFAVKNNRIQVTKSLLSHNANVNARDSFNLTATHIAAKFGYGLMIRALLDAGADLNLVNNDGQKPEDMAFAAGFEQIGKLLQHHRENPSGSPQTLHELEKVPSPEKKSIGGSADDEEGDDVVQVIRNDWQVFLQGYGLSELESVLMRNGIRTPPQFLRLTEEDLDKIGILSHHKKKVMSVIEKFPADLMSNPTPELPVPKKNVTSPDLYNFLLNLRRQLIYMESSLTTVERRFCRNPVTLQKGIETVRANGVEDEFAGCCDNVTSIRKILNDIEKDLKAAKRLGVKCPGLITDDDLHQESKWLNTSVMLLGAAVLSGLFYSWGIRHLNIR